VPSTRRHRRHPPPSGSSRAFPASAGHRRVRTGGHPSHEALQLRAMGLALKAAKGAQCLLAERESPQASGRPSASRGAASAASRSVRLRADRNRRNLADRRQPDHGDLQLRVGFYGAPFKQIGEVFGGESSSSQGKSPQPRNPVSRSSRGGLPSNRERRPRNRLIRNCRRSRAAQRAAAGAKGAESGQTRHPFRCRPPARQRAPGTGPGADW